MEEVVVKCPHCGDWVIIEQINCGIFRHLMKSDFSRVSPHASEKECKETIGFGCGNPFRVVHDGNAYVTEKCGWI